MDRNRQNIGPFVEDALRTITMMDVDVEDRHALVPASQKLPSRWMEAIRWCRASR
jgi:hypothetical protein